MLLVSRSMKVRSMLQATPVPMHMMCGKQVVMM